MRPSLFLLGEMAGGTITRPKPRINCFMHVDARGAKEVIK